VQERIFELEAALAQGDLDGVQILDGHGSVVPRISG
jgi:hypothetical protein